MDCCNLPESPGIDANRRQCGAQGRKVHPETMESLLKPEARVRLRDTTYFFDRTAGCDVVYFSNEAKSYFSKDELKVLVGIKETEPPVPICYCFGHTAESAREEILETGHSTVCSYSAHETVVRGKMLQTSNCYAVVAAPVRAQAASHLS